MNFIHVTHKDQYEHIHTSVYVRTVI